MENAIRTSNAGSRDAVGLLTGLLFGGLTGFGVMMLLAPRSGKETRTRIGQTSSRLQDRATGTFDDLVTMSHYDSRQILVGLRGG